MDDATTLRQTLLEQRAALTAAFPYDLASPDGEPGESFATPAHRLIPGLRATLAACEGMFGAGHADTRTARAQLGEAYLRAGDTSAVILLYREVEPGYATDLGVDHPDTMTARHLLGQARTRAQFPDAAAPMLEVNLLHRQRALGPDHPDTLRSRHCGNKSGHRGP